MRTYWITAVMSVLLTAACLVWSASEPTGAQEASSQLALTLDGTLDRSLPDNRNVQRVMHELCGVTLGGYCPGRYRACVRSGRPKAECEVWADRCAACNTAMAECRQKVGHEAGFSCPDCKAALDKCRASNVMPK